MKFQLVLILSTLILHIKLLHSSPIRILCFQLPLQMKHWLNFGTCFELWSQYPQSIVRNSNDFIVVQTYAQDQIIAIYSSTFRLLYFQLPLQMNHWCNFGDCWELWSQYPQSISVVQFQWMLFLNKLMHTIKLLPSTPLPLGYLTPITSANKPLTSFLALLRIVVPISSGVAHF